MILCQVIGAGDWKLWLFTVGVMGLHFIGSDDGPMLNLSDIFNCIRCREWYVRNFEEGPEGKCKHCFWNIPINPKAIIPEETMAELMACELEELLTACDVG